MSEREIRQVAHHVCGSECARGGGSKIRPIFVTEEISEDPRVDEFREKIHQGFDGLVLRTDIPQGRISLIGVPSPMHTYPDTQFGAPKAKTVETSGECLETHIKLTKSGRTTGFFKNPKKVLIWNC